MKQWVQHISGKGEKWEVQQTECQNHYEWPVRSERNPDNILEGYYLPKSEYRLCDPPEQWEDVTHLVDAEPAEGSHFHDIGEKDKLGNRKAAIYAYHGFRLRKVRLPLGSNPQWAFVVEQKVQS